MEVVPAVHAGDEECNRALAAEAGLHVGYFFLGTTPPYEVV